MDATTVDFTLLYILIEVQMPCFSQNLSPLCLNLTPVQLLQLLSNVHQYFERSSPVYSILHPVIEKISSPPATSAPVVWIFSHSDLIMWPNRAHMGDMLLSQLVFCSAIIPSKHCYWNRNGDIMLLVSCSRRQCHLASVEWMFSNLIDLHNLCHCEECCILMIV